MTESSLGASFVRGLAFSLLVLTTGVLADIEFQREMHFRPHWGMDLMITCLAVYGVIAMAWAWSWAGSKGPLHRLNARAAGTG